MIFSQIRVPLEMIEDERLIKELWYKMAEQMMLSFGYEIKYVIEFKKTIIRDDKFSPHVILRLECKISTTNTQLITNTITSIPIEVQQDYKVSRWERFKQFIDGR